MLDKTINIIVNNIMIVLYVMLILSLIIGQVNIITSLLICGMFFMFGYISFTKGVECQINDEIQEMYREKIVEEYNKIQDEIRNN